MNRHTVLKFLSLAALVLATALGAAILGMLWIITP